MTTIRHITPDDAAAFLTHMKQLDQETNMMMYEPDERTTTPDQMREMLQKTHDADNQTIFVAVDGDNIVGHLAIIGGEHQRTRHRAHIVIGILDDYTGQKIGTRLFEAAEEWAREIGLTRLELTVMEHNQRGIALYQKMGFSVEGQHPCTMVVDGHFVDELSMGKILD
jgi:RimJ/RimL family protein N-acetyltransferase